MKIFILTKRQYMNKDLIEDRYGRFRELPLALAQSGNEVEGFCLSYLRKKEEIINDSRANANGFVKWHCLNLNNPKILGLYRFYKSALKYAQEYKPDIILSFSDTIYTILGVRIAKKCECKCVSDLYDNFEAYDSAKIPGILSLFSRALKDSDGITTISNPLRRKIQQQFPSKKNVETLINGVNPKIFFPRDKQKCRSELHLPSDAKIIGTTGALSDTRGIRILIDGYVKLKNQFPDLHLVLAGKRDKSVILPSDPHIYYLGELDLCKVPQVLCALDVAVVCNTDTSFGNYCFPQKAHEILAVQTPLAATNLGALKEYLSDYPELLFEPTDVEDFVRVVSAQLRNPKHPAINIPTWQDLSKKLQALFTNLGQ